MRIGEKYTRSTPLAAKSATTVGGRRFAVVVSRFNEPITAALLEGAQQELQKHGAVRRYVQVIWVPGAYEIPMAAMAAARSGRFDAVVCLGCLIRGETAHFDYIAQAASHGILRVALDTGVPCTFGVLTTENEAQARARCGPTDNKGAEAALAAMEMAGLVAGVKVRGKERRSDGATKRRRGK